MMKGPQERRRCSWAERSTEESIYHDTEWGGAYA